MKRFAMLAALAVTVAGGSHTAHAQTSYGYSKHPMKPSHRIRPADKGARAQVAAAPQTSLAESIETEADDTEWVSTGEQADVNVPAQLPAGPANPYGQPPYYPGYEATPSNYLYGGSPYPAPVPSDQPGVAGCADGNCADGSCADGSCAAGNCADGSCANGNGGHGHSGHGHGSFSNAWWLPDATIDWVDTTYPHRGYVTFEYLNWEAKGANVPALLTTSPPGAPQTTAGVLGQPGTSILFGNGSLDDQPRSGGRVALGFWLHDAEFVAVEFNYAGLEQEGTSFVRGSTFSVPTGSPILAQPFFNTNTGQQDSLLLAYPMFNSAGGRINTGGLATNLNGTFNFNSESEIHTAGVVMKSVVWVLPEAGWRTFFLGGYRFFSVAEDLTINSTISPVGGLFVPGSQIDVVDAFSVGNQFHGGDLGLNTELATGPFTIGILTKVALGNNHQSVRINGSTTTVSGGATAQFAGGLYSQPTNIGEQERDRFTVIPEAGVNLGLQLTRDVKLTVGYNFLYINRVVRAAEQIDPNINPTQFDGGILVGQASPAPLFRENDFFLHGLNTGIEWKW